MTTFNDLLKTITCPRGFRCEHCGQEDLLIQEFRRHVVLPIVRPSGVLCLTLCDRCSRHPALLAVPARPAISVRTEPKLIAAHSQHLSLAEGTNQMLTHQKGIREDDQDRTPRYARK